MSKGYFITFEGTEKSGKSTQAKLLAQYLTKKGFSCEIIREPGSTTISEHIREILLSKKNSQMSECAEMLLYMAARAQLMHEVIVPALAAGKVVICDRFHDSTVVYQGYGLGINLDLIQRIGRYATEGIVPDLTLLLDLGVKDSLFKKTHVKDRIELRSADYHKKVRLAYLALAKKEPDRIRVITVCDNMYAPQRAIRKEAEKCLFKKLSTKSQ